VAGQSKENTRYLSDAATDDDTIDFEIIELLFFAYRDFTSDPDAILEKSGFGRAHHRVVHFVDREPGMTVADLRGPEPSAEECHTQVAVKLDFNKFWDLVTDAIKTIG